VDQVIHELRQIRAAGRQSLHQLGARQAGRAGLLLAFVALVGRFNNS